MKPTKKRDDVARADVKPYDPAPREAEALAAYGAAKATRGPRLKVTTEGKNAAKIGVDHPDTAIGTLSLMKAIGTADLEFYDAS